MIREDAPQRLSMRFSSLGETATLTAERRRTDAARLSVMLRGELVLPLR